MAVHIDSTKLKEYSSSLDRLVENVLEVATRDLKTQLKARDDKIVRMQERIDRQFDIIQGYKAQIEVLHKENEELKKKNAQLLEYNNNQAKTIAAMMIDNPFGFYKEYAFLVGKNL